MATTRELARATAPLGFFEPGFFGPRWLKEFGAMFEEGWVPEMEVFEKNNLLTVRLDVPGLTKEALTVRVAEGLLTVEGDVQDVCWRSPCPCARSRRRRLTRWNSTNRTRR